MCSSVSLDVEPSVVSSEEMTQEALVSLIARKIAKCLGKSTTFARADGLFDDVDDAVEAAVTAQKELMKMTLADRGRVIDAIREKTRANMEYLSRIELEETGMGRFSHKVAKHRLTIEKTPGLEDIAPEVKSGDDGLTLIERRPFGVAGCILPSTAPSCTAIHNSICMIAAGNGAVLSPHPGGTRTTLEAVRFINEAIIDAGGPKGLVNCLNAGSIEVTKELISHPKVNLLLATGGPAIVREILSSGKKAIGAGPGNPPVLVDETADIPKAAKDIIDGNSFENCLQCIGEKECFVVDCVADLLVSEMQKNGAYLLKDADLIEKLTETVTSNGLPNKSYIGKDAAVILKAIGIDAGFDVKSIIFEVPADHIIVREEYLMPLLPIVRISNVEEGIALAVKSESGFRHSAMLHSRNVRNITKYSKAVQTTILVKNGPSYSGVGLGGEGYVAMSIAGPTGEGLTSPRTFTRPQRCVMCGELNLRSAES
jgi:propionaldehyde dehydrogenase